jgi:hypothetical protein
VESEDQEEGVFGSLTGIKPHGNLFSLLFSSYSTLAYFFQPIHSLREAFLGRSQTPTEIPGLEE